jgi:predicted NAD/FAD-binding protein
MTQPCRIETGDLKDLVDVRDPQTNRLILQFSKKCGTIYVKNRGTWYIIILAQAQTVSDVLKVLEQS